MSTNNSVKVAQKLMDQGVFVQGGWEMFAAVALEGQPNRVKIEVRKAFFAGASHLFAGLQECLDEEGETTELETDRVEKISLELQKFAEEMIAECLQTEGNA